MKELVRKTYTLDHVHSMARFVHEWAATLPPEKMTKILKDFRIIYSFWQMDYYTNEIFMMECVRFLNENKCCKLCPTYMGIIEVVH